MNKFYKLFTQKKLYVFHVGLEWIVVSAKIIWP
jgi:hypothetical protein